MAAADVSMHDGLIAEQAVLEQFSKQPASDRKLTEDLRGVLAETACTGVIRYDWPLVRSLVVQQLGEQLTAYEAAEHVDVGPARPLGTGDSDVQATVKRFTELLEQFQGPPWTLQRLCELVLEPRKQYQRLHKLILAIEKLLLVTGEVGLTQPPPPLPRLDQLSRVNDPPASQAATDASGVSGQKRSRPEDADASGLVNAALTITGPESQRQAADGQSDAAAPATADAKVEQEAAVAAESQQMPQDEQQNVAGEDSETAVAMETDPKQEEVADDASAPAATQAPNSVTAESSTQ